MAQGRPAQKQTGRSKSLQDETAKTASTNPPFQPAPYSGPESNYSSSLSTQATSTTVPAFPPHSVPPGMLYSGTPSAAVYPPVPGFFPDSQYSLPGAPIPGISPNDHCSPDATTAPASASSPSSFPFKTLYSSTLSTPASISRFLPMVIIPS